MPSRADAKPPRISVVVPTTGRASIERCLEALRRQTLPPLETIVAEDARRRGPSWARNEGIRRASGELVAFTDDDCVPPADWLERLAGALERFRADAAGGGKEETDPRLRFHASMRPFPSGEQEDRTGAVHDTANLLVRRPALERLAARDGRMFDERMRVAEDADLLWRIRRRGGTVAWSPVRVVHLKATTFPGYLAHRYRLGKGSAAFHRIQEESVSTGDLAPTVDPPPGRTMTEKIARLMKNQLLGPFNAFGKVPFPIALAWWLGGKADAAGIAAGHILGKLGSRP